MAKKSHSKAKRSAKVKHINRAKARRISRAPKRTVKSVKRAVTKVKRIAKKMRRAPIKQVKQARVKVVKARAPVTQVVREALRGEANLLVTFDPNKTFSAKQEVEELLKGIGENYKVQETNVNGVFKVTVKNPREAIKKLTGLCKDNPDRFARTYRWIPVDKWCSSNVSEMQNAIKNICDKIEDSDKWKMDLEKRQNDAHERDLIIKLTEVIDKPNVDLKNPDKIIKVDIIGNEAGISILRKDEYLNVVDFKK